MDTIRVFAISKIDWIRQQQKKLREQEPPREYLDRESHYIWGARYLVSVAECDQAPAVTLKHRRMILIVRPGMDTVTRDAVVAQWYREQMKAVMPDLCAKWESVLGLGVNRVFVQRMKTKWGKLQPEYQDYSSQYRTRQETQECLQYVVAHEMVHLLAPTHGPKFLALIDRSMPHSRQTLKMLNRLPAGNERWSCDGGDQSSLF